MLKLIEGDVGARSENAGGGSRHQAARYNADGSADQCQCRSWLAQQIQPTNIDHKLHSISAAMF